MAVATSGPDQRRDQHRVVHRRADVADPDLHGRVLRRQPGVPVEHPLVEHHPAGDQLADQPLVVLVRLQLGRRRHRRPALPLHRAPTRVAGVLAPANGELVVTACSIGSHGRTWLSTCTPVSGSGTPTCTCMPLLPGPGTSSRKRSIIRSKRGLSTTGGTGPSTGPVPMASSRTPARSAASASAPAQHAERVPDRRQLQPGRAADLDLAGLELPLHLPAQLRRHLLHDQVDGGHRGSGVRVDEQELLLDADGEQPGSCGRPAERLRHLARHRDTTVRSSVAVRPASVGRMVTHSGEAGKRGDGASPRVSADRGGRDRAVRVRPAQPERGSATGGHRPPVVALPAAADLADHPDDHHDDEYRDDGVVEPVAVAGHVLPLAAQRVAGADDEARSTPRCRSW